MKWIFLFFVALLAFAGNAAIFESVSWSRAIGGIAFTLFVIGLLLCWWSAYFSKDFPKQRRLDFGLTLAVLSIGAGMIVVGINASLAGSCEHLLSRYKPHRWYSQLAAHVESLGYCSELGVAFALLGLLVAYLRFR